MPRAIAIQSLSYLLKLRTVGIIKMKITHWAFKMVIDLLTKNIIDISMIKSSKESSK